MYFFYYFLGGVGVHGGVKMETTVLEQQYKNKYLNIYILYIYNKNPTFSYMRKPPTFMEFWIKNITFLWCEDSQRKMNNKYQKINIIKIFFLMYKCPESHHRPFQSEFLRLEL